jgi:O-antigen/teichoic acid export membrane protein
VKERPRFDPSSPSGLGLFLRRGASGVFAVNVLGTAAALGAHAALTYLLGAEHYGVFATVFAWGAILLLPAVLGFDTSFLRFLSQYRVEEDWSRYRGLVRRGRLTVVLAGVGVGALTIVAGVLLRERITDELAWTFVVAALVLPVQALALLQQAELRAMKRVVISQLPLGLLRPALLAVVALLVGWWAAPALEAPGAMAIQGLAVIGALGLGWGMLRALRPEEAAAATPSYDMREWVRVSVPVFLVSGMRVLLNHVDILLIGILVGTTDAGIYAIASRVARLMTFGLTAGNAVAAPLISEAFARRRSGDLQRVSTFVARVATASSLAIGLVLVISRSFALGLFGAAFEVGGGVLLILAIGHLVNAFTGPVGLLLNLTGHQNANARISGVVTLLNAILNVPAILLFGMEGAAVVTAALIATQNLWAWVEVRRRLQINGSVWPFPPSNRG